MGHAIRAAMGTVWETWGVWPVWTGCVMGRPSGTTHHHMIIPPPRLFRLLNTTALMTPSPRAPSNKFAPWINALSTAIDGSYVSGQWHYSCMTSTPQTKTLLMLYKPSNIDRHNVYCSHKGGARGKKWKRTRKDGRAVIQKHPRRRKKMERSLKAF